MKRSEMLDKLDVFLATCFEGQANRGRKQTGEALLSLIEDVGMLPPTIRVSEDMYIRSTGEYGYDINEWEEENE